MKLAFLTAGAAGMYCGSCMLDNALARQLIHQGHDALLIPVYTPIRTDEEDVSIDRVFMGGVNVFLQQKLPWLRWLPHWVDAAFNQPWLIRRLTANAGKTSPKLLGSLAVSMLQGMQGNQRKEVARLCDWLERDVQPDVMLLTNLLIGGCIPEFKRRIHSPVFVILQGDDIFLDSLPENYRKQAIDAMRRLVSDVDGFIVHSQDYGQRMAQLLEIPEKRWHVVPLGIETQDFEAFRAEQTAGVTIGYFARMAPEKGLHHLVDAFIELSKRTENADLRLQMAGWMGPQHSEFWSEQLQKLNRANVTDRWSYRGSLERKEKLDFFRQIDLLSVPTTYREPKGLFVLEAVAAGIPYIQPDHGAFPELHQRLQAGWLFPAGNQTAYVAQLQAAIDQIRTRREVPESFEIQKTEIEKNRHEVSIQQMATRVLQIVAGKL
jgi:glycosyltransferase involved in cell wall biosynthesis